MSMIKLSQRLQRMADLVIPGGVTADIGTDHGHLPVWLYENEICPGVIMSDISPDSLAKAKAAAGAYQFGEALSFRIGDGLAVLSPAEADTVVIAGMGGKLIRDILAKDPAHTASFRRFVLQPRTASGSLRKWLLENGFAFVHDDVVKEGNFIPEIITVEPDRGQADLAADSRGKLCELEENDIRLRVPSWILSGDGPVEDFLQRKLQQERRILEQIRGAKVRNAADETRLLKNIAYLQMLQKQGKERR